MSRYLRIYLADLAYFNRLNRHTIHVPKNIGYVASYAKKVFGNGIDIKLFKEPNALLGAANECLPDVIGMSFYFWNTQLIHTTTKILRERFGSDLTIIWGGPSVDSDSKEQARLFERFPEVDAFVPDEGELGFAAILERLLSKTSGHWDDPIDGVVHMRDGTLVKGRPVGLSLDLAELPSPYLNGILDDFIHSELIPGLQTSRLRPYTCSFCVSGKNKGKLRAFPIEQVEAELDFIGRTFADRPHITMHINDENFGVIRRDAEIAEYIVKTREKWGYPQSVFFYPDKKLSDTTKQISLTLSHLTTYGMTYPLQTQNPEAVIAAKRKNITHEQVLQAIEWASANDLPISTEFIFGLPGETRESFAQSLDGAIKDGFDTVLCNTLFIVDGIELNRQEDRERLGIKTRFRQIRENYGMVEDRFCAEVEEVVVETNSFDLPDFLDVRKISMMFYACFNMRFHYWLMSHFRHLGLPLTNLMRSFLDEKAASEGPWRAFANDFKDKALGELFISPDELREKLKHEYIANGNDVGEASQLNILFGSRLIYEEKEWVDEALLTSAHTCLSGVSSGNLEIAHFLIDLYRHERLEVQSLKVPEPIETRWDVLAWRKEKFQKPLSAYRFDHPRNIVFSIMPSFLQSFDSLRSKLGNDYDRDFFLNLLQIIGSRSDLLLHLEYVEGILTHPSEQKQCWA